MLIETIQVGGAPLTVEVAVQPADQSKGLSGRGFMNWNRGMIFMYPTEEVRGFWMRNTDIPLSIAFFDSAGVIVHVADMHPNSEEWVMSPVPCRGAIEANQGWFARNGVGEGSVIDLGQPKALARVNPEEVIVQDVPASDWTTKVRNAYGIAHLISAPIAMGLSYQRNKSLVWALLTGFVPLPYLVYRYVDRE